MEFIWGRLDRPHALALMADSSVGVQQAASPDRQIDNASVVTEAGTVYRQRTEDVEVAAVLRDLRRLLGLLGLAIDPATGVLRAVIGGTGAPSSTLGSISAGTITTVSTVTVLTALANLAPSGVTNPSQNLLNDQPLLQRAQIVVSA